MAYTVAQWPGHLRNVRALLQDCEAMINAYNNGNVVPQAMDDPRFATALPAATVTLLRNAFNAEIASAIAELQAGGVL